MLGDIGVLAGEKVSGCCCRCCPPNLVGVDGICRRLSGMVRGGKVASGGRGRRERLE